MDFDFSGWATRNDLLCADGRTIRKDAFKDNDGETVPLVWNHQHNDPDNVLGHALLENRAEGVYAYCKFNDTPAGKKAKSIVMHGDVSSLSIWANRLKEVSGDVLHGTIRELSLVLAGANPGAYIDYIVAHSITGDDALEACYNENIMLYHSAEEKEEDEPEEKKDSEENNEENEDSKTESENEDSETESEEKDSEENDSEEEDMEDKNLKHADDEGKTIGDVMETLSDEQQTAVAALLASILEDHGIDLEGEGNDNEGEDKEMKHNIFENEVEENVLSHDAMQTIIADGKRMGSLKESFLAHAAEYGIDNIDWLFPDARNITNQPEFIKRNPDAWVNVVMSGVHHTPFSRIKMMFADLREDDARAKGYAVKAQLKKEEVFGLIKRTVEPTTIYKKQKLDRDDIIDITDFDVVAWLKGEMRMMLDEEIARAILFGDGRSNSSPDKIKEDKIIPIAKEASLYKIDVTPVDGTPQEFIDACVRGQNNYEGSGNTILFTTNAQVTEMLLIKDLNQHRMYKDMNELALACSVNRIVKVPDAIMPTDMAGLIVDLSDYNVGADAGGSINMFDDFDIDYNQQKYLIETRCSGALTKPFSAVAVKKYVQSPAG